ncbi:MAG: InlB B-repeat-containing protein [Bacilli bacterium]|nr:InlB B-repeat-containing protein [Bacilli bacterium]
MYYVVNGKLRLDLDDAFTFKAYSNYDIKLIYGSETNLHTINFMDTNLDHLSTVYVEDNGDPIEPIAPTKPKSVFIGWVLVEDYDKEVLPVEDVTEVNKDSVFVAKYELDEIAKTTTYNVSINGTSTSYKINEVVTSTAGAAPEGKVFSHWEDENGNVLSSNPTYKFTVLADTTINAVFNDAKEYNGPIVNMSNALSIREGYVTYKGQFELVEGFELVEYGFLFSRSSAVLEYDDLGVTVAKSNVHYGETKEFLMSFPGNTFNSIRAYLIVKNTTNGALETLYSENYETEGWFIHEGFEFFTSTAWGYDITIIESADYAWLVKETRVDFDNSDRVSATKANGVKVLRLRGANTAYIESEKLDYVSKITFDAKYYNESNNTSNMIVSYQLAGSSDWVLVKTIELTDSYVLQEIDINKDNVKIRIDVTTKSANIDNLKVYGSNVPKPKYEVSFNLDYEGAPSIPSQVVKHGFKAIAPETPTREGYDFLGWYLGENEFNFDSLIIGITELYAKWDINKYKLTLPNDVESNVPNLDAVPYGTEVTLTVNAPRGKALNKLIVDGIDITSNLEGNKYSFVMLKDILVEVEFIDEGVELVKVIFDYNHHSIIHEVEIEKGETVLEPIQSTRYGYEFLGWYLGEVETPFNFSTPINENITLTARWSDLGYVEEIIYETGFESSEGFTASTKYDNTELKIDGLQGRQWKTYYGTSSTTGAITDSQSMQMRWYSSASTNFGYTYTDFVLDYITKVTFNALNTSGNNIEVTVSIDQGENWIAPEVFQLTTSKVKYEYNVPFEHLEKGIMIRFKLIIPTTPTSGSRITLDDVKIYRFGMPRETFEVSFDLNYPDAPLMDSVFVKDGDKLSRPANPTRDGYSFKEWQLNGNAFDFNTPVSDNIELVAIWEEEGEPSSEPVTVTASYSGDTTTNMTAVPVNNAETIGLDSNIFTVSSIKGGPNNEVGLNKAGQIRLYGKKDSGNGNTLQITINDKYIIKNVKLKYGASTNSATAKVIMGEADYNIDATNAKNIETEYSDLNIHTLSIQNTHETTGNIGQIYILSIEIIYIQVNP